MVLYGDCSYREMQAVCPYIQPTFSLRFSWRISLYCECCVLGARPVVCRYSIQLQPLIRRASSRSSLHVLLRASSRGSLHLLCMPHLHNPCPLGLQAQHPDPRKFRMLNFDDFISYSSYSTKIYMILLETIVEKLAFLGSKGPHWGGVIFRWLKFSLILCFS